MSDEWKLGVVYVCPERDIECGSFERNWCANCPKRRATPPSPSTAPTQQDQANVSPPFAAPAGQHGAWIAMESQRPEDNASVIASWTTNYVNASPAVTVGPAKYMHGNWWANGGIVYTPTHWMPFPPPPDKSSTAGAATKSVESSTAPTVEVDERAAFEAWYAPIFKGGEVANMPLRENGEYRSVQDQIAWLTWQARASKPPAREAAERQSIDTPEFHCLAMDYRAAKLPRMAKQAYDALIAHIDTWGGAVSAQPLAYIAPHVMESLRAGCHVATTLTPKPDGSNTEAVYGG